jgi:hypothetical protein
LISLAIFASTTLVLACPAIAQAQDSFAAYRAEMRRLGLRALVPATSAFVPGYIYSLEKAAGDNRVFVRTVCEQAFVQAPREIDIGFPSNQRLQEGRIGGSARFLPGFLADKVNAILKLDASSSKDVVINIPRAMTLEVAQRVTVKPGTSVLVRRQMRPECAETLKTYDRRNGNFVTPMFLVVQATYPIEMLYTLKQSSGAGLSIDANAAEALNADFGLKASRVNNQSFRLEVGNTAKPLFIAANWVQLKSLNPNTEISATPSGDLRLIPVSSKFPVFETEEPPE